MSETEMTTEERKKAINVEDLVYVKEYIDQRLDEFDERLLSLGFKSGSVTANSGITQTGTITSYAKMGMIDVEWVSGDDGAQSVVNFTLSDGFEMDASGGDTLGYAQCLAVSDDGSTLTAEDVTVNDSKELTIIPTKPIMMCYFRVPYLVKL